MTEEQQERFFAKINRHPETGCWEWTAGLDRDGYGVFKLGGKKKGAHRVSWEHFNGEIPDDIMVLHKCDNRKCANPEHLYLGDNRRNMYDAIRRRRTVDNSGEANGRAKLTEDMVRDIRRVCADGTMTQQEVAKKYNLNKEHVSAIILRKIWRHI